VATALPERFSRNNGTRRVFDRDMRRFGRKSHSFATARRTTSDSAAVVAVRPQAVKADAIQARPTCEVAVLASFLLSIGSIPAALARPTTRDLGK